MFEIENFSYIRFIHPFEWAMLGIYMIILVGVSFFSQVKNIKTQPIYRYYPWAIFVKVMSAVVFCLIYIYYYNGGDTVSYYETSRAIVNLGMKDAGQCLTVMTEEPSLHNYLMFDGSTGYPWPYMYFDSQAFFVAKMIAPILFVSFKSYLVSSVILSWISFFGAWRLFLMLCRYYPGLEKWLAFGVLFIPSVLFWGSGILKDTITFSAVCWFIVALDAAFISKRKRGKNIAVLFAAAYVLLSIKPYILISLLPGALVWVLYSKIAGTRSKLLRYLSIPLIYLFAFAAGYGTLAALGNRLGKFSIERMFQTAAITQRDLKQDYYRGSSFDIGEFEPTVSGVAGKIPAAVTVGLFRPFVWEARNLVMLISGIENFVYLVLSLLAMSQMIFNPKKFFRILLDNPLLIFLLSYTLLFSALVGLSTSNFGALVRFKIPFLPAFVCSIIILNYFLWFRKKSKVV
jgi:hypothetical protein